MTLDTIIGRARSLCLSSPFSYTEAVSTESFALDPTLGEAAVVKVTGRGGVPLGGFDYQEECNDFLDLEVTRPVQGDYRVTHRLLHRDARSLTAAITRDGSTGGGDYLITDGRSSQVVGAQGAAFLTLRLTLPVNYISTL